MFLGPGQVAGINSSREIYLPYRAESLNMSASYFGDLIKTETGKPAQDYIQDIIIDVAKEKIFNHDKSVSEITYELGFKYPQHFARLFKQRVGYSPGEYRGIRFWFRNLGPQVDWHPFYYPDGAIKTVW